MVKPTVEWFHLVTGHPGQKKLRFTINQRYYHPELRKYVDQYKCTHCERHKLEGKGYGLLPEHETRTEPFEEVAVDLIGPWKIKLNKESMNSML